VSCIIPFPAAKTVPDEGSLPPHLVSLQDAVALWAAAAESLWHLYSFLADSDPPSAA
jgi:hypothetical protein